MECLEEDGSEPVSTSKKLSYRPDITDDIKKAPSSVNVSELVRRSTRSGKTASDKLPDIADAIARAIEIIQADGASVTPVTFHGATLSLGSTSRFCKIKGGDHHGNHIWFKAFLRKGFHISFCVFFRLTTAFFN
jgi:hypothetical protein